MLVLLLVPLLVPELHELHGSGRGQRLLRVVQHVRHGVHPNLQKSTVTVVVVM